MYSEGNTTNFTDTNGVDGQSIQGDKGDNGHTPEIIISSNGNWFIDGVDIGIKSQGPQCEAGLTPHIGENGDWCVGNLDTGVKAEGVNGDDGVSVKSSYINEYGDSLAIRFHLSKAIIHKLWSSQLIKSRFNAATIINLSNINSAFYG